MITNEELFKVQKIETNILEVVASICKKYKINYWLDAGTLLGAKRHMGFIPWDDDIDIGVMRDDYKKLLEILPKELPPNLILQTTKTDKNFKLDWAKVRDLYSEVIGKEVSSYKYNGLRIDIFPFDYVPTRIFFQRVQLKFIFFRTFLRLDVNSLKNKTLFKVIIHKIANVFPMFIYDFIYNLIIKSSNFFFKKNIACYFVLPAAYPYSIRKKKCYFPLNKIVFEEKEYKCPNDVEHYLETLYGINYMTPVKYPLHIKGVKYFKTKQL